MVSVSSDTLAAAAEPLFRSAGPGAGPPAPAEPQGPMPSGDAAVTTLPDLVDVSISMCDKHLQPDLRGAVVLSGGTTMLGGLVDRVKAELVARAASGAEVQVIPRPVGAERGYNSQRKHAPWIGGSMLASLSTFDELRISKQEYEDMGDSVLHRKCF